MAKGECTVQGSDGQLNAASQEARSGFESRPVSPLATGLGEMSIEQAREELRADVERLRRSIERFRELTGIPELGIARRALVKRLIASRGVKGGLPAEGTKTRTVYDRLTGEWRTAGCVQRATGITAHSYIAELMRRGLIERRERPGFNLEYRVKETT